jgi:NADH dehydrogenase
VNDFVRETAKYYPSLQQEMMRVVVVHPGTFLLAELGEEFGRYAERKLRERKVKVMKGLRVVSYDGSIVLLSDGTTLPAATLIWTAGVKPPEIIKSLPLENNRGRLRVNEYLAIPGVKGLWTAGDCAAVPMYFIEFKVKNSRLAGSCDRHAICAIGRRRTSPRTLLTRFCSPITCP